MQLPMSQESCRVPDNDVRKVMGEGPSDHSLLIQFRGGDQDAAAALYNRYAHRLRALAQHKNCSDLASRLDCDDIVQSVFESFFRGVYRGSYDVPAGEELWHLFLVITLNKIRAKGVYHRAAKRDVRMTSGNAGIERYADPLHSNDSASILLKMSVEEALSQLPAQHKQVVELRMEGHEVADIAERTGRSKRSIERILQECRKKLARLLEDA
jgi:RNA polymerase sigma-70 factor (ECF subfamily)